VESGYTDYTIPAHGSEGNVQNSQSRTEI
jgi:hypothetical protein